MPVVTYLLGSHHQYFQVEKEKRLIVEEDRIEECSTESLMEELPSHQPRFVVRT